MMPTKLLLLCLIFITSYAQTEEESVGSTDMTNTMNWWCSSGWLESGFQNQCCNSDDTVKASCNSCSELVAIYPDCRMLPTTVNINPAYYNRDLSEVCSSSCSASVSWTKVALQYCPGELVNNPDMQCYCYKYAGHPNGYGGFDCYSDHNAWCDSQCSQTSSCDNYKVEIAAQMGKTVMRDCYFKLDSNADSESQVGLDLSGMSMSVESVVPTTIRPIMYMFAAVGLFTILKLMYTTIKKSGDYANITVNEVEVM